MNKPINTLIASAAIVFIMSVGFLMGAWLRRHGSLHRPPSLIATFPRLGSGHCAIVQTPEGRNILFDTGSTADADTLAKELGHLHISTIDLLILTSTEETAIGGVPAILNSNIHVRSIWTGVLPPDNPDADAAILAIQRHQVPNKIVHSGDSDEIGPSLTRISVLWPLQAGPRSSQDPLICRVDYGNLAILLCGGSTAEGESSLVGENAQHILTAGQHCILEATGGGVENGTGPDLLRLTTPEIAVINSGNTAALSHPVLQRLEAAGAEVWRTDVQGNVTVTSDGRRPPVISSPGN